MSVETGERVPKRTLTPSRSNTMDYYEALNKDKEIFNFKDLDEGSGGNKSRRSNIVDKKLNLGVINEEQSFLLENGEFPMNIDQALLRLKREVVDSLGSRIDDMDRKYAAEIVRMSNVIDTELFGGYDDEPVFS